MYDVIIIGAGPAGLAAALYTARAKLTTLLLGVFEGSDLHLTAFIGNYPGFTEGISGPSLQEHFVAHARRYGAQLKEEEVVQVKPDGADGKSFRVITALYEYRATALIIASGRKNPRLGVSGEKEFVGKGVAFCVTCDGPFFKDKPVLVVGSGAFAAAEALDLTVYTSDVTLLTNGAALTMEKQWQERLRAAGVRVHTGKVKEILGDTFVTGVKLDDGTTLPVAGVFIATGSASSVAFAQALGLEMRDGAIAVDRQQRTNVPGVYAAGEITGPPAQVVVSAGEGAVAAIALTESLRGSAYIDHRRD